MTQLNGDRQLSDDDLSDVIGGARAEYFELWRTNYLNKKNIKLEIKSY